MSLALEADIKKKLRVTLVQAICALNNEEVDKLCADEKRYDRLRDDVATAVKVEYEKADRIAMINF